MKRFRGPGPAVAPMLLENLRQFNIQDVKKKIEKISAELQADTKWQKNTFIDMNNRLQQLLAHYTFYEEQIHEDIELGEIPMTPGRCKLDDAGIMLKQLFLEDKNSIQKILTFFQNIMAGNTSNVNKKVYVKMLQDLINRLGQDYQKCVILLNEHEEEYGDVEG